MKKLHQPIKNTNKKTNSKQMCQRLTRALAQVTQVTHQVIHYLHPTKKLNKFNTIKIKKIDTVFTNSKYSRTSDQH